jgi:multicomponent K+:H+ antiporter subunit G
MSPFDALSPLVSAAVGLLAIVGAAFALIGSIGLLRLPTFFERVHPPTLGTTAGVGFTLAASMLLFSALESRAVVHELLIAAFTLITTPVTYLLLVRAAKRRDGLAGEEPDAADAARDRSRDAR